MDKARIFLIALLLAFIPAVLMAEFPERTVDLSVTTAAGFSNNYFSIGDFFPDDGVLLIDLDDLAESIGSNGFRVASEEVAEVALDVRLPKNLRVGVFMGTKAYVLGALPDSLFDLLAEGNAANETISGDLDLKGDLFVEIGARASLGLGPWEFSLSPAYFASAFHVDRPTASFTVATDSGTGTMTASGTAVIPVYSAVPYEELGDMGVGEILDMILSTGGFDLSLGASYQLFPELKLGASLKHVPVAPSRPGYRNAINASFTATAEDIISGSEESFQTSQSTSVDTAVEAMKVFRPFKGGVSAVYRPEALSFLTVHGNLDLAIYQGVYADFSLGAKATLANALTGSYSFSFEDLVWKNRIGFIINLRVFELNGGFALQSPDFLDSFTPKGMSAGLGVRFGY